jgi:hypothetical protein
MTPEQRSIWHIGTAFLLLLLLLSCRMVYWQVVNERAFQPLSPRTDAAGTESLVGSQAPMPGTGATTGLIAPVLDPAPHVPGMVQQPPGSTAASETTVTPVIEPAAVRQSRW